MPEFALTPSNGPNSQRRRGRPPGAKSKRSLDLAKYVEATMGGQTPGQQSAQLCMVTAGELKRAKADAKELGIVDLGLPALTLAMVVKAVKLASALSRIGDPVSPAMAWAMLTKERGDLMPYVHQKRAPAAEDKGADNRSTVFLVPDDGSPAMEQASIGVTDEPIDFIEDFNPADHEVKRDRSSDAT